MAKARPSWTEENGFLLSSDIVPTWRLKWICGGDVATCEQSHVLASANIFNNTSNHSSMTAIIFVYGSYAQRVHEMYRYLEIR